MPYPSPYQRSRRILVVLSLAATAACTDKTIIEPVPDTLVLVTDTQYAGVERGASFAINVSVTRTGPGTGPVSLTVSGAPAGVTTVISNIQRTPSTTSAVITITVGGSALPGLYPLEIRSFGDGLVAMATFALTVALPAGPFEQWATAARSSTEYSATDWSARQATGAPNVTGCADDPLAWASRESDGVDWLELEYSFVVRASEIRIFETLGVSSIVKVELRDEAGTYHVVHTTFPASGTCPRQLVILVPATLPLVNAVRISVDQRTLLNWNEIDAVKLLGNPESPWDYLRGVAGRSRR